MIDRVLIAGGGTGGHLFPGVAVVEELRRRLPHIDALFVGTERGIEARALPQLGERFRAVDVKPLQGRRPLELVRNLASLPASGLQALSVVHSFKPDLAIGLGGYAAGPLLLSAAALRVPTALLEQNVHVGLTNRLLAKSVGRAYLTYPETATTFGPSRARVFGNPVRRAFVDAARMAQHDPAGARARSRTVFVLGGSQGARVLNDIVPQALARAGVAELGMTVVHQTGADMAAEVERRYHDLGVQAEVVPFIDDVARAYVQASLVIARAGATTLAELCAIGRAAILVPYPHAAEDHQTRNAVALERAGAVIAIAERDLAVTSLTQHVQGLLGDAARRKAMEDAARRAGRPDAAAAIVDDLFQWLGVPSQAVPEPEHEPPIEPDTDAHGARAALPSLPPIRRKPRLKRAELRVRAIEAPPRSAGAVSLIEAPPMLDAMP